MQNKSKKIKDIICDFCNRIKHEKEYNIVKLKKGTG